MADSHTRTRITMQITSTAGVKGGLGAMPAPLVVDLGDMEARDWETVGSAANLKGLHQF